MLIIRTCSDRLHRLNGSSKEEGEKKKQVDQKMGGQPGVAELTKKQENEVKSTTTWNGVRVNK